MRSTTSQYGTPVVPGLLGMIARSLSMPCFCSSPAGYWNFTFLPMQLIILVRISGSSYRTKLVNVLDVFQVDDLPPENADPVIYEIHLRNLISHADIWDRGRGWISWLEGMILERARKSSKCKRGDYGKILQAIGIHEKTAYNCRRIAQRFLPEKAKRMGYTEMLRELGWSSLDKKADLVDPEDETMRQPADSSIEESDDRKTRRSVTDANLIATLDKVAKLMNAVATMPKSRKDLDKATAEYRSAIPKLTGIIRDAHKALNLFQQRTEVKHAA